MNVAETIKKCIITIATAIAVAVLVVYRGVADHTVGSLIKTNATEVAAETPSTSTSPRYLPETPSTSTSPRYLPETPPPSPPLPPLPGEN